MSQPTIAEAWLESDDGQRRPIPGNCALGRSPSNDVVFADERVSRRHALIHAQGQGEFWLVDLGSSNGTYLNGCRVAQPVLLREADRIQIGLFAAVFRQRRPGAQAGDRPRLAARTIMDIKAAECWLLLADIESSTELARGLAADQLPIVTGRWFSDCREIVEANGGSINQYLGDGFLAYWPTVPEAGTAVGSALEKLERLQVREQPRFRVVVHLGPVVMGGVASLGEESLSGGEVNFIFRMEKLVGSLGEPRLLSAPARDRLKSFLAASPVGTHALSGFEGLRAFYTWNLNSNTSPSRTT